MRSFIVIAIPFASVVLAASAVAAPTPSGIRYATILEQTVSGASTGKSTAENMLMKGLIGGGADVIRPNPMARTRLVARDLVKGAVPEEITALEADILVAATVDARPDQTGPLFAGSPEVVHYRASLEAVLIAVDTQQVLETFSLEGAGIETDQHRAIQAAFERAGASLAKRILESTNRISRRVEILVDGLPPATGAERLTGALLSLPGAKAAKVAVASAEKSKAVLYLDASAPYGPALARAIDRLPDAGVVVTGFTERTIHASYSMTRAVQIPIAFARFSGKGRARGEELAIYIGEALLAQGSLKAATDEPIELASTHARREDQLARLGLLEQDALYLWGRYTERAGSLDITAEVHSTRRGQELLVRDHGLCPRDQLLSCSSELGKRLIANLPAALVQRRTEGTPQVNETISRERIDLEPELFPARAGAYRTKGIGRVVIKSPPRVSATRGTVRIFLPQLMVEPVVVSAPDIAPGKTAEIPIVLDVRDDPRATPNGKLELAIEYDVAGRRERINELIDVPVFERYALDWREPDSIAAFVTERAPAITDLAARALKAIPQSDLREPFACPAALFYSMSALGYQKDPAHPSRPDEFDDVRLPAETLARGYGDCEDLAVLYSALAESRGIRTILIVNPVHVIVAIDSQMPAQSAAISLEPARVIVHEGRAFIPIETTRVGSSFSEAWDDGAKFIAHAKKESLELRIVDVRDARASFPAVTFKPEDAGRTHEPASWDGLAKELRKIARDRVASLENALRTQSNIREHNAQTASHRAMLLLALGRAAEARRVLEEISARLQESAALANNLANIHLASGDFKEALALYDRALAKTKDSTTEVRVHLNAAIAARAGGKAELCHHHTTLAMQKATKPEARAVVDDFLAALSDGGLVPGAEGASVDRAAFAARLRQAIVTHASNPRGNAAQSARISAVDLVYWLDSEGDR